MSLTVRFPTGVSITYNSVSYLIHGDASEWKLYVTKEACQQGKTPVAIIQPTAGCLVEFVHPCSVSAAPVPGGRQAVQAALKAIREREGLDSWVLADLKLALRKFNARSRSWKP